MVIESAWSKEYVLVGAEGDDERALAEFGHGSVLQGTVSVQRAMHLEC